MTSVAPPYRPATDDTPSQDPATDRTTQHRARRHVSKLGALVAAAGIVLSLSGAATWMLVQNSLAAENITVAKDAAHFGGEKVNGPLTAYYQADIIKHHALEASQGKTYAELDRDDPVRATVMNASFLRASLFTSVVSFGIAAMAMGLGLIFVLIGFALHRDRSPQGPPR